ncbi:MULTISPECIES: diguanylate cyclase [Kamptonema]|uniref:diguanylate cyclase n=1 Tax=Kamptonema TaxID=1501433 RepID=UPI0001DAC5F2|nr:MULTISPECIES: diguanylate cyclase [Kamptonema]CBN58537.1 putative Diguanylate kinase [Kamptonema sp. PCC 6506]
MNDDKNQGIDPLTQITNRKQFEKYLEEQWQHLALEQKPISMIYCDIDCLKTYNDHYGHSIGDDCICQIAKNIRDTASSFVDISVTARCGGDEFWIILPNTDATNAIEIAEKIRSEVNALQIFNESPNLSRFVLSKFVTLSLGVSTTIPDINVLPGELLRAADTAIQEAKNDGRNRVIFKEFTA